VWARLYDASGEPAGAAFAVNGARAGVQALAVSPAPRVTMTAAGGLAFAWSGAGSGDDAGAFVTLLLPAGAPPPPAETVASREPPMPHDPPVSVPPAGQLPNGGDPDPTALADFGFQGITQTQFSPPDPHVAVGPDHVVAMVNDGIAWWSKNGVKQNEQRTSNAAGFWGAQGATNFVFDPEVIFDPYSRRFMAMACERNPSSGAGSSYFLLAVSDDADPNGTWHKYRFDVTAAAGSGDIDSPQIAVDATAVYLSADFFRNGNRYFVYILEKAPLLVGAPPTITRTHVINGELSHGMPVMYQPAPGLYLVHHGAGTGTSLVLHALQNPLTTPTRVTTTVTVPAFGAPVSVPQLGTSTRLSVFNARFWSCVYRNGSLWACHHHGSGGRTLARWYEIRMNGWPGSGTPVLVQSGDVDPGAGISTFFNSISVDGFGNALMCYARSSPSEYLSIERSYRLAGDPPGTMRPGVIVKQNTAPYAGGRWGDYSAVGVDPFDHATFWYHHEYAAGNSWITWIGAVTPHEFALSADGRVISAASGGSIGFALRNPAKANAPYLLLGSASGTTPGFLLPAPPGNVRMPLNFDGLTATILSAPVGPFFNGFVGRLDANGGGAATLALPALPAALVGATLHFAFCQDGAVWDFASNPVEVRIAR
jgi:hypothetical protein